MTHCEKVLAVLADGQPHSTSELYRKCGGMILHSRIADLRAKGHDIACERVPGKKGTAGYRYTWLDAPPQLAIPTATMALDSDEIAPRTERERFRIYRVRNGGDPEIVATVSSPEAIGVALCTLGTEGEFDDTCVGVMDSMSRFDGRKWVGKWLVKPWQST